MIFEHKNVFAQGVLVMRMLCAHEHGTLHLTACHDSLLRSDERCMRSARSNCHYNHCSSSFVLYPDFGKDECGAVMARQLLHASSELTTAGGPQTAVFREQQRMEATCSHLYWRGFQVMRRKKQ